MSQISECIRSLERVFHCRVSFHDYEKKLWGLDPSLSFFHMNPVCDSVKNDRQAMQICTDFDAGSVRNRLVSERTPFFKICHMGIIEMVLPIFNGSRLSAAMFVGPFATGKYPLKIRSQILFYPGKSCSPDTLDKQTRRYLSRLDAETFPDILNFARLIAKEIESSFSAARTEGNEYAYKDKIERFIDREFRHKLYVSNLARHLFISESRTCQLVREIFGMTFTELLTQRRIEHARHLLKRSFLKTDVIARECGFSDSAYFFRIFRKHSKETPSEFRRGQKKNWITNV